MQITLIAVGTLKENYLSTAVAEYVKRISAYATFREVNISEVRITDEEDAGKIGAALKQEGEKILAAMPQDAVKIALCVEGRQYTSEELARLIGDANDTRGKLVFVIGSSHGLDERVKAACDIRLSVSKMTFPHQLMRVILTEGIYRSLTILAGKKYHK